MCRRTVAVRSARALPHRPVRTVAAGVTVGACARPCVGRRPDSPASTAGGHGLPHRRSTTTNCFNCGVCMDVCPVRSARHERARNCGLASRPAAEGALPLRWMMEYPTQVGGVHRLRESACGSAPSNVVTHRACGRRPDAARSQRRVPLARPVPDHGAGRVHSRSEATREALKPDHPSPVSAVLRLAYQRSGRESWQAWRSMVDGDRDPDTRPARTACPAGTDAGRYVGLVAAGTLRRRLRGRRRGQPVPLRLRLDLHRAVRGRVPPRHARRADLDPHASSVSRSEHGRLPAVGAAERKRRPERVAIVGGGPAGMSAAYYLVRLGYGGDRVRGDAGAGRHDGDRHPGVPAAARGPPARRSGSDRGAGRGASASTGRWAATSGLSDLKSQGYGAIFHLATGASKSRRLGVPGDKLPGVVPATYFLKQVNLGEEACISRGRRSWWAEGSTAMDAARSALRERRRLGHRGSTAAGGADMPAQPEEIEAAEREGSRSARAVVVDEVLGNGAAPGRCAVRCSGPQGHVEAGRAVWESVPGSQIEISCAGTIFVAIGEEPDPSILPPVARGSRCASWAGIMADPRTSGRRPRGRLCRWRCGVGTEDRHRRRRERPPGRCLDPPVPVGVPRDGEAEIFAGGCDDRDRSRPQAHARPSRRGSAARGAAPGLRAQCGSFRPPTEPGLDRHYRRAPRHPGASAATPSTAAGRCRSCSGRGPQDGPVPAATMAPAARRRLPGGSRHDWRSTAVNQDQRSRLFINVGEPFVEGTIAAALVALWLARPRVAPGPARTCWRRWAGVHAPARGRPLVDHLRRRSATSSRSRSSWAASSSFTRTS